MNNVRNTAVILVILAGVIGSYFILKNPDPVTASGENDEISKLTSQISGKNPIQWVEKAKEQISIITNSNSNSSQIINLTDLVAKSAFGGMEQIIQTTDGSGAFDVSDPKNQEAINTAISGIQDPLLGYDLSISDEDIKISQNNSAEAKNKYFMGIGQIVLKNFNINFQSALKNFANNLDISGIKQIIDAYSKILDEFLNIEVPSDYLDLHKRYVVFLKKAKAIYSGLADYNNDPVRTGLLLPLIPEITKEELAIRQEYYQESLNLGL